MELQFSCSAMGFINNSVEIDIFIVYRTFLWNATILIAFAISMYIINLCYLINFPIVNFPTHRPAEMWRAIMCPEVVDYGPN